MKKSIKVGLVVGLLSIAGVAVAFHSWGLYHWARESNPFTLTLGENLTSVWDPILQTSSADWSVSSALDTTIVAGASNPKTCKGITGRIEVCNAKYGNNGWLGIAQIWITGGEHITKGVVKVNDTYFSTAKYNTTAWRNLVMCQEVGHTFGLGHQDENFSNANLNTCMDYTNDPTPNQHPNAHDYEELESIYAHTDSLTTILSSLAGSLRGLGASNADAHADFGHVVARYADGKPSFYAKELAGGDKLLTHVFWAE